MLDERGRDAGPPSPGFDVVAQLGGVPQRGAARSVGGFWSDARHLLRGRVVAALVDAFGYGLLDLRWLAINAMKSAFLAFDERLRLINGVIKPGYERLKAELQAQSPRLV